MITTKLRTNIAEAIIKSNEMLESNSEFMNHYCHNSYINFTPDMADFEFLNIMRLMATWANANEVEVKLWTPWAWRFSSAVAMTKGEHIYLNKYKLNRSTGSIVGSIFHELTHILDIKFTERNFGHGNNYRDGKKSDYINENNNGKRRTAPYIIGELAKKYVDERQVYQEKELQAWPQSWS